MLTIPNLFRYASSELSQDAFICWLVSWADAGLSNVDPAMNRLGNRFLNAMLSKFDLAPRNEAVVRVEKQVAGLDILVLVDDDIAILIEDKIHSGQHSNQLDRYKREIQQRHPTRRLLPIYAKTGMQSSYTEITNDGYVPLLRNDFLSILRDSVPEARNAIASDFLSNLEAHDAEVMSFLSKPAHEWTQMYFAWMGFYEWLQASLVNSGLNWDYVPNPRGGFLGAWWHFVDWDQDTSVYLQIEQGPLCFKIGADLEQHTDEVRMAVRRRWGDALMAQPSAMSLGLQATPRRRGAYMTVASIPRERWLQLDENGTLDKQKTLQFLARAANLVDTAAKRS